MNKRQPDKLLAVSYMVRDENDLTDLEARFAWLQERCSFEDVAFRDGGLGNGRVPVSVSRNNEGAILISLDTGCEVVIKDFKEVRSINYGPEDLQVRFNNDVSVVFLFPK